MKGKEKYRLSSVKAVLESKNWNWRKSRKEILVFVILLLVGVALLIFLRIKPAEPILVERNAYGEGSREETLYDEEGEEIHFSVEPQEYTEEELKEAFSEGFRWARKEMLGENSSAMEIRSDLNLVTELPGGFTAEWISENPDLVSTDGTIYNESMKEEEEVKVCLSLLLYYKEEMQMEDIYLLVKGPHLSDKEKILQKVRETIADLEEKTRGESSFSIPADIEGVTLLKRAPINPAGFLLLAIPLLILPYWKKKSREKEQREQRRKELLEEYPIVVNKLSLYLGAGLNLRMSFQSLLENISTSKSPRVYLEQELVILTNQWKAGVSERQAYEAFGRRIGETCYIRLTALLVQNYQKGNEGLLKVLNDEEESAFRERLERVRKEGEEAGTKLLFPMLLLLIVVMCMIMAPAVIQFQSY